MAKQKRKPYEGHIWKHGKKFYACYSLRGTPRREPFHTREEAETCLIAKTLRKRKGRSLPSPDMQMGNLFDLVISDMRTNRCRSTATEKSRIENHLRTRFGHIKVAEFHVTDLKDFIQERRKEGASDATINRELSLVRRGFVLAFEAELLDFKVPVKLLKERPPRKQAFSEGEYQSFRSYLPDDVGMATDFQREVGWRMQSEVLPLEWGQIDFTEECVTLPPYSTKDDSDEPREFFFTARMRDLLKQQRAYVDALQKRLHRIIPQVFPTNEGQALYRTFVDSEEVRHYKSIAYFDNAWEDAIAKANILKKGTHHLRVTACVERDNAGLSIHDNCLAGGWSPKANTIQRYLNKSREDKKAAARKIDEYRKTFTKHSQSKI